jgi:hypothetical protein
VAIAWHTGGDRSSSLKVAYSSDLKTGGGTWNSVDPPPAPFGALDVLPRVAISASGKVAILYYEDAVLVGPTPLTARYLSATGNGQPAWARPLILSAPFSPENMVHQAESYKETGTAFIGDYVGLTFDPAGNALATWADGRRNRSDIFFKSIISIP